MGRLTDRQWLSERWTKRAGRAGKEKERVGKSKRRPEKQR